MDNVESGMSLPRWVDSDTIMVPATVQDDESDTIGDGAREITSGDPAFQQWAQWLAEIGQPRPERST